MGILRVADKTEKLARAPFCISTGSLVFCETAGSSAEQIRCQTSVPRISWFLDSIVVLLTHWRYIPSPLLLRGDSAKAWSYIEILSAPVLLPANIELPHIERPLSWWLKHQVYPELELEQELFAAIKELPPIGGAQALSILAQHPRKRYKAERPDNTSVVVTSIADGNTQLQSILGRVRAIGALMPEVDYGSPGFLVDMAVDPAQPGDDTPVSITILLLGQHFLGLFVAVCVDDSLLLTDLQPSVLLGGSSSNVAAFATTATSRAFRIDEFDGLEESQICVSAASQTPFTQQSQRSLLSQITHQGSAACTGALLADTQIQSPAHTSPANDCHLAVHDGKLESYTGEVTRVVDTMLGIYVIDDSHLLMLTFWPLLSPVFVLRPGSRVLLDNMHVLLLSDSDSYCWNWLKLAFPKPNSSQPAGNHRVLIFGACTQSSIRIIDFPLSNNSAEFAAAIDGSLVVAILRQVCGLVQMIEVVEALWVLRKKFPNGPLAAENQTKEAEKDILQATLQMALALSGYCGETSGTCLARQDSLIKFANHRSLCQVSQMSSRDPCRVVTLREVMRRYVSWRKQKTDRGSGDLAHKTDDAPLTNIYPSQLQLEGIPLIGRLAVNERGCVYLRDETAELRVCVSAAVHDPHLVTLLGKPTFSGQNMIGHVCIWHSWHLVIESVGVAPGSDYGDNSKRFSQVYARISSPTALHIDRTFGGVADSAFDAASSGFLFVAHSQGPSMPQLALTNGVSSWETITVVKGVRISIDSSRDLKQLHLNDCSKVTLLEIDGDFQAVSILCRPGKTPVCFAPGSAYVVCTLNVPQYRKPSAATETGFALFELGALDHVHPVRLDLGNSASIADCTSDAGLSAIVRAIPSVRINAESSRMHKLFSKVYSVGDLFSSGVTELEHTKGGFRAASAESIISVCGIISQYEVKKAVEFATAGKRQGSESMAGQLESHITLYDSEDSTKTVVLYMKLASYSHPLGLVPGAKVVCRDVNLSVSKSSGNPYLNGTAATSIDKAAIDLASVHSVLAETNVGKCGEPVHKCIGALYAVQDVCNAVVSCQVKSVESLKLAMTCVSCKQVVCNMGCGCIKKQHTFIRMSNGAVSATVCDAELLCLVSDGSGIAWASVSNIADIECMLGLSGDELDELCGDAARMYNGQLLWKAVRRDRAHAIIGVMERATAAAVGASVLVEGTVQRGVQAIKRQQLRLDGRDIMVDKLLAPRITALRVTRPTATELCWRLLNELAATP
ncbi:hypothetical protein GGH96_005006 [Coemansia sp. RSA 1972]|nr:hypothetical protein GGH96_005006 [Coemansia sp. RSA 1972]